MDRARRATALYKEARDELNRASIEVDLDAYQAALDKYERVLTIQPGFIKCRQEVASAWYALGLREEKMAAALNIELRDLQSKGREREAAEVAAEFDRAIELVERRYRRALDHLYFVEAERPSANVYWQMSDIFFFFEDFKQARGYLLKAMNTGDPIDDRMQDQMEAKLKLLEELMIRQELETSG